MRRINSELPKRKSSLKTFVLTKYKVAFPRFADVSELLIGSIDHFVAPTGNLRQWIQWTNRITYTCEFQCRHSHSQSQSHSQCQSHGMQININ